jgi:hypothetical protein
MADTQRFQVRIDSILGGHSRTTHFGGKDQFRASVGIDPGSPLPGSSGSPYSSSIYNVKPSGLIRPVQSNQLSGTMNQTPYWMSGARSTTTIFVLDSRGSVYTHSVGENSFTALNDIGATTGSGNGMSYYDNYQYFATNTDIARYGPLDGTPVFTPNYWTSTLGLTALSDSSYPFILLSSGVSGELPNHYLHRHSDGRLYIADVVGNQGYLHYIKTTKTTVEGDTNAGSTYQALALGFGIVPICMESFGSMLVIATYERDTTASTNNYGIRTKTGRAKIAFWDTLSQNFNSITWVEFPDALITAMKNVNGKLFVFSTPAEKSNGFRVSQYIGGYTFEEVWSSEEALAPLPGAVDGTASRLVFGSYTLTPKMTGCIYSLGLSANGISNGIFCPFTSSTADNTMVTALMLPSLSGRGKGWDYPVFGSSDFSSTHRLENIDGGDNCNSVFWSMPFRIGQRFKVTKIRIPLAEPLRSGVTITPSIYTDDGFGTLYALNNITITNYPATGPNRTIVIRPNNVTGESNFWLELKYVNSYPLVIGLPITIEYEIIPDD